MTRYNKKYNFTIVELVAAMLVVGILIGMTAGVYSLISTKTKNERTKAIIKKLEMAMRSYQHDTGYYFQQSTLGNLKINNSDDEFIKRIDYSRMINTSEINDDNHVTDAWGNPIFYQCPGSHNTVLFDLISTGKNGTNDSGSGDDITNFTKNQPTSMTFNS